MQHPCVTVQRACCLSGRSCAHARTHASTHTHLVQQDLKLLAQVLPVGLHPTARTLGSHHHQLAYHCKDLCTSNPHHCVVQPHSTIVCELTLYDWLQVTIIMQTTQQQKTCIAESSDYPWVECLETCATTA